MNAAKLARVRMLTKRLAESAAAIRQVATNPGLRRLELAWAGSMIGTWSYGIALLVYAYGAGGARAVGLVGFARWTAAAFAAPFTGVLGDRFPRARVMIASDLVRAAALGVGAAAAFADLPLVVYVVSGVVAVTSTAFRPAQAALVPSLARTPEELLEFLRAQLPEPGSGRPDPDAVPRFLAGHPAGRAFVERLMNKPVPASYAQTIYHAEHAFRFTAVDGTSRFGRYRFVPRAGEASLSPDDAGKRSPSFLREELEGRLRTGPVAFRLLLQLAEAGDPTDDVTALWPEGRPVVELGRLEVTGISPTSAADERRLIFDPTNRTDGIDLSADPILLARSAAYSISYDRRSKGE